VASQPGSAVIVYGQNDASGMTSELQIAYCTP
jgi:hypothetical protein